MTLLAGSVIDAARDRHVSFQPKHQPSGPMLRFLSRYVRELHGKIARLDEDILRVEEVVVLPLADHTAGIVLPANRTIVEIAAVPVDGSDPVIIDLIPAATRNDRNAPFAAAWQVGDRLYLRSPATAWNRMTAVGIWTVPIPVPLVNAASELPVPDTAENAVVEALAAFMASRVPGLDVGQFKAIAAEAERVFLDDVQNRLGGRTFRTRDVWP